MFQPASAQAVSAHRRPAIWPVVLHLCLVLSGMIALVVAPPASGKMLLVPIGAHAEHDLPRLALNNGAALVGAGPIKGSMVVDGDRGRLLGVMTGHAILVLGTSMPGCSAGEIV